jgi:predicted porin
VIDSNKTSTRSPIWFRGDPAAAFKKGIVGLGIVLAATSVAHAQSAIAPASDDSLTFHGITLYGIVDVGFQDQSHGAPINDYFVAGSADIVQKNSNHSVTGVTPSNLSQSRIGLQGVEPIVGDWSGVFKLETFFNPQSGDISDALRSLAQNNGRALASQTTNLDSSVAGQTFQQAFAGFSSKTFGTITFGRQNTVLADGIAKYDPNFASQAFSLIGLSGTTAGGGDTQDRRLDSSLKYVGSFGDAAGGLGHLAAEYKFNQSTGSANSAFEVAIGGEFAGLSIDAYYTKIKDAVSVAALSAAQVTDLAGLCPDPLPAGSSCIAASPSTALAATVSDNTAYALMGLYNFGEIAPVKLFGGYEHIQYANPATPLTAGFNIANYTLAFVNVQSGPKSTYANDKTLQVYWAGFRYTVVPDLDLVAAYYGYKQNTYGTAANDALCSSGLSHATEPGTCSGTENAISFDADYRMTKRFDGYIGVMYTGVKDGLAAGYDFHTTDITTTMGVRFKF